MEIVVKALAAAILAALALLAVWNLADELDAAPGAPDYSSQKGART